MFFNIIVESPPQLKSCLLTNIQPMAVLIPTLFIIQFFKVARTKTSNQLIV